MSRKTHRAAAFAAAAMFMFALTGIEGSGARAQENQPAAIEAAAEPQDTAAPRFVAQQVVQQLPAEAEAVETDDIPLTLGELVTDMPVDIELSRDMRCLAQAVYFEARGEPLTGQLAVARVVINRAGSGLYPADYCSVVTQRAQFSFVKGGRIPPADETSPAWLRAKAIAQVAHQDLWECEADDALYFHATYVRPGWARRKTQVARIDTHVFYR